MTTNLSNLIEYDIYAMDISQLNDVSELCRLCLDKCDDMVSIYGVINVFNQETTSILDELQQFSSTELSKDPRYPSCICSNCLDLLKISSKIRLQMKFTQKELDNFFNNLQSDSKLECMEPEIKIEEKDDEKSLDGNQEKFPIEVISSTGSFKLDELLVEERIKDNLQSYDGFLNNLGSVISARYVNTDSTTKIQIEEPSVEIIKFINKDSPEKMSLKSFTKHKQKKSSNKTSRKKTSKIKSPKDETEKAVINNIINPENKSKNPTSLLCQICGFLATKKQQLRYHMHSKHTINERHHVCNICNKAFVWKHTLEQHKAVHNNERRFLCTVCGNNFNYLSALIYHMRTHTGEKRYRCDYCPKVFSMSWGLTRHLRVHTGAKPYNCEFCNKAFASTTEVKSHERTHTGEKPFQCHVCQKKFSKKDNMNVHFLTHDGPSKCSICSRGFMNPKILKLHHKFVHNQNVKKIKRENVKVMENEDVLEEEGNVAEKEYIREEDEEEEVCEEESDEQVEIVEENVGDFMNEGLG